MADDTKDTTATPPFNGFLTVVQPFGDFQRGDKITDLKTIADVLSGENAQSVNKVGK